MNKEKGWIQAGTTLDISKATCISRCEKGTYSIYNIKPLLGGREFE